MDIEDIIRQSGITEFQKRVYLELLKVPPGTTVSYGELARRIGCRSAQAVGQALKRNPFAVGQQCDCNGKGIVFTTDFCVPCHRVIASDGSMGGFHGQVEGAQIVRKKELLAVERAKKGGHPSA